MTKVDFVQLLEFPSGSLPDLSLACPTGDHSPSISPFPMWVFTVLYIYIYIYIYIFTFAPLKIFHK
jgi:hypothetical protein